MKASHLFDVGLLLLLLLLLLPQREGQTGTILGAFSWHGSLEKDTPEVDPFSVAC